MAVNAAVTLQRPLLIKGEPGTGKTCWQKQVASSLGMPTAVLAYQIDYQSAAGSL